MEEELKTLVRANGFIAVFESLKGLVESEYNRSKADYDFLATLLPKKKEPVVENTVEQPKVEEQVVEGEEKVVSIFSEGSLIKKKKRVAGAK
jgi:hypothetical protein